MVLIPDQRAVQQFGAKGLDPAFGDGVQTKPPRAFTLPAAVVPATAAAGSAIGSNRIARLNELKGDLA
jgi:hypothetical protein